jgi:cytochrome c biogenesis protein CcmG/thiol:disulfide interchange protein DsbE
MAVKKILLIFIIILIGCNKKKKTVYKNTETNDLISENAYLKLQTILKTKIIDTFNFRDSTVIKFQILKNNNQSISTSESEIQLIYKIGKKVNFKKLDISELNNFEFDNKPTVINFWFTECYPCITEIPTLEIFKKKYLNEVNFIAITYSSKEDIKKFQERHKFTFHNFQSNIDNLKTFGVTSYPTTLFIDKNGFLIEIINGASVKRGDNGNLLPDDKRFKENIKKLL